MRISVILTRHTQTFWNAERRYSGQRDVPLNEIGRQQARNLARSLDGLPVRRIISSDLIRSKETAQIIGEEWNTIVEIDPRLREVDVGEVTGMVKEDAEKKFPEKKFRTRNRSFDFRDIGGESALQVLHRYEKAILDAAKSHRSIYDYSIVFVGHGSAMRNLLWHHGHTWDMSQGDFQLATFDLSRLEAQH